jgi:hypothetical protein
LTTAHRPTLPEPVIDQRILRAIRWGAGPVVSVRVKGINRLPIPGSFDLVLKADGEPIG